MIATPSCAMLLRSFRVLSCAALIGVSPRLDAADPANAADTSGPAAAPQKPSPVSEWKPQSPVTVPRGVERNESKAHKSLDVKSLSPLTEQLGNLGIFSGFYDFDEGVEDRVVGVKNRNEVSFANQTYIQSEYHIHPDQRRENGFVGLWASFPLRAPGEHSGGSFERLRTKRDVAPGKTSAETSAVLPGPGSMAAPVGAGQTPIKAPSANSGPVAVSGPSPSPAKPFPFANLFRSKPKPNLIPTGAQPMAAPAPAGESAPKETAPGESGQAVPGRIAEKRPAGFMEQLFGRPGAPPRRTGMRSNPWFHR